MKIQVTWFCKGHALEYVPYAKQQYFVDCKMLGELTTEALHNAIPANLDPFADAAFDTVKGWLKPLTISEDTSVFVTRQNKDEVDDSGKVPVRCTPGRIYFYAWYGNTSRYYAKIKKVEEETKA